jgi:hypothetical protein
MRSKLVILTGIALIMLSCSGKSGYSAELSDVDGTWVSNVQQLANQDFFEVDYAWGRGKTLVHTSLEVDLAGKFVLIPGDGEYTVDEVVKEKPDVIRLQMYRPDTEKRRLVMMKFHFESYDKFWLECTEYADWIAVGKDKPWYRLSGPEG